MLDGLEKYLGLSNLCNFWATVSSRDSRLRLQVVKQVVSRTRARLVRYHDCNDPHALLVIDELLKNIDAYIDVCDDILPRLEQPQFGRRANDVQLENLRDTVTGVKNTLPDSGYGSSKIAALLGSRPELHVLFRPVRDDEQVIYPLMGFANRTQLKDFLDPSVRLIVERSIPEQIDVLKFVLRKKTASVKEILESGFTFSSVDEVVNALLGEKLIQSDYGDSYKLWFAPSGERTLRNLLRRAAKLRRRPS